MLPLNARVILRTFNGTIFAPSDCQARENYWALIGRRGTVVETTNDKNRVLVQFDSSVSSLGLHCHNLVPNSLYILESDLEPTL